MSENFENVEFQREWVEPLSFEEEERAREARLRELMKEWTALDQQLKAAMAIFRACPSLDREDEVGRLGDAMERLDERMRDLGG
jgi:hypothetical protein